VLLGFRYKTDEAYNETGVHASTRSPSPARDVDGAESDAGWTFAPATGGFRVTTGVRGVATYNHYYVAELRHVQGVRLDASRSDRTTSAS
jgi:hypothetical protein